MKTTRARMTAHRSAKVEENAISRSSTIRLTLAQLRQFDQSTHVLSRT